MHAKCLDEHFNNTVSVDVVMATSNIVNTIKKYVIESA